MESLYWEMAITLSVKPKLCANFNGEIDNLALSRGIVYNRIYDCACHFNHSTTDVLQLCVKSDIFLQVFGNKWKL